MWLLTVALAVGAALLQDRAVTAGHPGPYSGWWLWLGVAAGFALAECVVIHLHFGREAQAFGVGEIPLVVGLFLLQPGLLVAARLVGGAVALGAYRRQPPAKLAFNLAQWWFGTVVGVVLFQALAGPAARPGSGGWGPAVLVAFTIELVSNLAVTAAISVRSRRWVAPSFNRTFWIGQALAVGLASFALLALNVTLDDWTNVWAVAVVAALLVAAQRAHLLLQRRHDDLARLNAFTREVGTDLEVVTVCSQALTQVRELMHARVAEIELSEEFFGEAVLFRQTDAGLVRTGPDAGVSARRPGEVLSSPLRGDGGQIGALRAAERRADAHGFDAADGALLTALAGHVTVALHNGRLADRLRDQVQDNLHQALHDPLTGLGNRLLFDRTVAAAVAAGPAAVLLLDIDRFKEVNDTLGHAAGDTLLEQVAERLRALVPNEERAARLGGDEFVVVLPGADLETARRFADGVRTTLLTPLALSGISFAVQASIGIALAPEHGNDTGSLLRSADVAMYSAKAQGTGVEVYASDRDHHSSERLALVSDLRRALVHDELFLEYQPKVAMADGTLRGAEALVRWNHPQRGVIYPDNFIPVAEQTGLIGELTAWVLTSALRQCREWDRHGVHVDVSVNVSPRTVQDPAFPAELAGLLLQHGVPAGRLTLEITEGALMSEPERALVVLARLRGLGVRLSVDDLGVGHSSLAYLKRLPVDEVKVDKSFVMSMTHDAADDAIVCAVVDLVHRLGMTVVAEGVEDEDAWYRLQEIGCDVAQGFWLSRPIPAAEVASWAEVSPRRAPRASAVPSPRRPTPVRAVSGHGRP